MLSVGLGGDQFMRIIKRILMGIALLAWGTANASTVLSATDGDVNFLFNALPDGIELFMFDDDDNNNFADAGNSLLVPIPSIVGIAGPISGNFLASNTNGNLTLTTSPDFVLAVLDGGAWVGDTNAVFSGDGNAVELTFATSGGVFVVDVAQTLVAVPVPAAVWLFGSGLLGLVGIGRRRN